MSQKPFSPKAKGPCPASLEEVSARAHLNALALAHCSRLLNLSPHVDDMNRMEIAAIVEMCSDDALRSFQELSGTCR